MRADGSGCRSVLPSGASCPTKIDPPPADPLADHPDNAAWSPGGTRLAVDVVVDGFDGWDRRIAVVDPATGSGEILPSRLGHSEEEPTWQATADLAVTLTGPTTPILTGATADLTLHVVNGGIAGAPGARTDLALPAGLVAAGDPVPSQGTCTAALHCDLGALPVGGAADVTLTVRATAPGAYPVTGSADSDLIDHQPQDNTATAVVTDRDPPPRPADPAVSVTVVPSSVLAGEPVTVTFVVTNRGEGAAKGVVLVPAVPAGVTVGSAVPVCPVAGCALGDLAPGATVTVTRTVSAAHALSGNAVGTVSSASADADPANNTATAPLTVRERPPVVHRVPADPAVAIAVTPGTAYTGGAGTTATVTVSNPGRAKATGLTVAVVLPPGVRAGAASAGEPCATTAGCPVGDLDPGASSEVTLRLTTPRALTGTVTANLSTTGSDASTANDTATARLTVRAPEVRLTPEVGPPGAVTQARGRDFPPGAVLRLTWNRGVTVATAPVRVGRDGTFSAPVLVLTQDALGPRDLRVADSAPVARFGPVRAAYLVVPGVLQPSDFTWRR
ncbi:DUF11 domain-containing protein [Streptomyces sp.]|uniref:DUF11 domain-containing protein n=1 Tax=Streptomyces sp. TaxID=1931 RepID=UPI002F3ECF84